MALSIAGSDPSGGAGLQADLKVFALHRVFGCAAVAALTVQDTRGVATVRPVPASLVAAQALAVLDDLPVAAVKTGMLAATATVTAVARALAGRRLLVVVDPVMLATGGQHLLAASALPALRERLLTLATLVTPNLDEAEALTGLRVRGLAAMHRAGRAIRALGAGAALIKGGHLDGAPVDVLVHAGGEIELPHRRARTVHKHGTGCVLSAAIAARLARGASLPDAVTGAVADLQEVLSRTTPLGRGRGPADPLVAGGRFGRFGRFERFGRFGRFGR